MAIDKKALPLIGWIECTCRAEFIRPIMIGDKEVAMSYDALCKGRHSLHYQVYCITTVTRVGALLNISSRIRYERVWYRLLTTARVGTVSG